MKLYEREWVAINYFCNKRYRKLFITEATKRGLNEGITDSLKKAWDSAKAKAESFLSSIAGAARDLIPDGFLVGLSKLGEKGKQIWKIVSTIGGQAYTFIIESIKKLSDFIKNVKKEAVVFILKIILRLVYKVNKPLYNKILGLSKQVGFDTGLELVKLETEQPQQGQPQQQQPQQGQPQQQQPQQGQPQAQQTNESKKLLLKEDGGGIRGQIADLVEQALEIIQIPSEEMIDIINQLFPFKSSSPEGIATALIIPLLQGAGKLSLDTVIDFFTVAMNAIKSAGSSGGFKTFKENTLQSRLISNFDLLKNTIVGVIRGSTLEALLRVVFGDLTAGADIVKQLFKFLVDTVKAAAKDQKGAEATEQATIEGVNKVLGLDESKISLHKILYTNL